MVDYADIGKRIRACRLAKGMTQGHNCIFDRKL